MMISKSDTCVASARHHGILAALGLLAATRFLHATEVSEAFQPLIDRNGLIGVVTAICDKERVLEMDSFGYADRETKCPMKEDTLFWIASTSKPMTATVFMMLVDEGKVALDDPVEKHIPSFVEMKVASDGSKPVRPILLRDLLSHTSGLPFAASAENPTLDTLSLEERVAEYSRTPLLCHPGTEFHYSNAGINTIGRVMEIVTGKSYEQLMAVRLFTPLGMKDTTFRPTARQLSRLAKSYKANQAKDGFEETKIGQLSYPLDDPKRTPVPAGGLFSTADDVAKFARLIASGGTFGGNRLISEASVVAMTTKQTGDKIPTDYGFGWSTAPQHFGHAGAFSNDLRIYRGTKGINIVFMVQQEGPFPNGGDNAAKLLESISARMALGSDHGRQD